jgi:hypothetical protein
MVTLLGTFAMSVFSLSSATVAPPLAAGPLKHTKPVGLD